MKVDLDKADLVCLVKGITPNYEAFDEPLVKRCGYYEGGFSERWEWNKSQLMEHINTISPFSLLRNNLKVMSSLSCIK